MAANADAPVLLDDLAATFRHLTTLGRDIVSAPCNQVREAVLKFVSAQGWEVVAHERFEAWVSDVVSRSDHRWLVLDPLLPLVNARNAARVQISRVLHGSEWRVELADMEALGGIEGEHLAIVDDAASSGATLVRLASMVADHGAVVTRAALCCASGTAAAAFSRELPDVLFQSLIKGRRRVIHLRDACPYAPFSGRPSATLPPVETHAGPVAIRVPSTARGGLWGRVFSDYRVLSASVWARSAVAALLSEKLGRNATVADLALLGPNVTLPAFPRHQVSAETSLSQLGTT